MNQKVLCGHCIYPILNLLYNACTSYKYLRKLIMRMMPPTRQFLQASTHKPESSHTIENDPVLFIICFQSFKELCSVFNLIYMLEHTDSTACGSKPQIPWEIAIRLNNKSVSWQWHCTPTMVKSSCRWLSGSDFQDSNIEQSEWYQLLRPCTQWWHGTLSQSNNLCILFCSLKLLSQALHDREVLHFFLFFLTPPYSEKVYVSDFPVVVNRL